MAAYSAITSGQIDAESPLDITLAGQWTDNVLAMFEGAVGAPRLQLDALDSSVVSQSKLKSASGIVSTIVLTGTNFTLPGGEYGFYPSIFSGNAVGVTYWGYNASTSLGIETGAISGITPAPRINIATNNASYTAIAAQRYIQASPPYDLGDGEIPLFVFVEVDINGDVVSAYAAPEAPWHYNGPTNIRADYYSNGIGYQWRKDPEEINAAMISAGHPSGMTMASAKAAGRTVIADYIAAFESAQEVPREITQAIKNADMNLIPRPMEPHSGNTVIMLDPVADIGFEMLGMMKHDEFSVNELLHSGDIIIDNTPLARATPQDVQAYAWRMR